jgi:hypothetical protein
MKLHTTYLTTLILIATVATSFGTKKTPIKLNNKPGIEVDLKNKIGDKLNKNNLVKFSPRLRKQIVNEAINRNPNSANVSNEILQGIKDSSQPTNVDKFQQALNSTNNINALNKLYRDIGNSKVRSQQNKTTRQALIQQRINSLNLAKLQIK